MELTCDVVYKNQPTCIRLDLRLKLPEIIMEANGMAPLDDPFPPQTNGFRLP